MSRRDRAEFNRPIDQLDRDARLCPLFVRQVDLKDVAALPVYQARGVFLAAGNARLAEAVAAEAAEAAAEAAAGRSGFRRVGSNTSLSSSTDTARASPASLVDASAADAAVSLARLSQKL